MEEGAHGCWGVIGIVKGTSSPIVTGEELLATTFDLTLTGVEDVDLGMSSLARVAEDVRARIFSRVIASASCLKIDSSLSFELSCKCVCEARVLSRNGRV